MTTDPNEKYTVELSVAQWDLVVLGLGYVFDRAQDPGQTNTVQVIDKFARKVLRRRVNEVVTLVQSIVPDAGSDVQ